jgi:uncharacterized protein involved in exopolysaccharide biosynthesis
MPADLDHVTEAAKKLVELRERIAQLDEERAALQQQMTAIVADLTAGPIAAAPARAPAITQPVRASHAITVRDEILTLMLRSRGQAFTSLDIGVGLGDTDSRTLANIRTLLSRMNRENQIEKVSHGRYRAK